MSNARNFGIISLFLLVNILPAMQANAQNADAPKNKLEGSDARDKKHLVIIGNVVKLTVPWWDSFVKCAAQANVASNFYKENKITTVQAPDEYVKIFSDLALDRLSKDRQIELDAAHGFLQDKFSKAYESEAAGLSLIIRSFGAQAAMQNAEKWKPQCSEYVQEYKTEFGKTEPKIKEYLDAIGDKFVQKAP